MQSSECEENAVLTAHHHIWMEILRLLIQFCERVSLVPSNGGYQQ